MSQSPTYQYTEELSVECSDSGVITATMNRPDRLNAFNGAMRYAIRAMLRDVRNDPKARALVLTGAGRGFCSGADLAAQDRRGWPTDPAEPEFGWCLDLLEMPKPTIAAINGVAAGGGLGLALLCDIRFCADSARLLPIWLARAIHPDDLVTWTLPRLVGYSRALKWLYLAKDINLAEAAAAGLIESPEPAQTVLASATALAETLAKGPTTHYALTKQAVLKGLTRDAWDTAALESWGMGRARQTADAKEGVTAFREQRDPNFLGH